MIIVLLVIFIGLTILGFCKMKEPNYLDYDWDPGAVLAVFGVILSVACIVATIMLSVSCSKLGVIDKKIAMYEEENTRIETQIAEAVQKYQEYETGVFASVTPESSITLVSLYPELKADTLVSKQIEVYIENNNTIKELKKDLINGDVVRWWLYFGGR